jgi:FolB domain-containing protein
MTHFEIKNLKLRTIIGANSWEREVLQDVIISISYKYDASQAEESDNIKDVFNYKALTKKIIEEVESSTFNLLESLVNHVYTIVKANSELQNVKVIVEKPFALRFCDNIIATKSDDDK